MLRSFDSLRKVFTYANTLLVHRRIASNSPCAIKQPNVSSADIKRGVPLPITDDQAHAENYACADKSNLAFFRQTSNGCPVTHHCQGRIASNSLCTDKSNLRFFGRQSICLRGYRLQIEVCNQMSNFLRQTIKEHFTQQYLGTKNDIRIRRNGVPVTHQSRRSRCSRGDK